LLVTNALAYFTEMFEMKELLIKLMVEINLSAANTLAYSAESS